MFGSGTDAQPRASAQRNRIYGFHPYLPRKAPEPLVCSFPCPELRITLKTFHSHSLDSNNNQGST